MRNVSVTWLTVVEWENEWVSKVARVDCSTRMSRGHSSSERREVRRGEARRGALKFSRGGQLSSLVFDAEQALGGSDDVGWLRRGGRLERLRVWHRHVRERDAHGRRVEVVERLACAQTHSIQYSYTCEWASASRRTRTLHDARADLGADAALRPPVVARDEPVRLLHALDDRALVHRAQRAQVDHLRARAAREWDWEWANRQKPTGKRGRALGGWRRQRERGEGRRKKERERAHDAPRSRRRASRAPWPRPWRRRRRSSSSRSWAACRAARSSRVRCRSWTPSRVPRRTPETTGCTWSRSRGRPPGPGRGWPPWAGRARPPRTTATPPSGQVPTSTTPRNTASAAPLRPTPVRSGRGTRSGCETKQIECEGMKANY